MAGNQGPDAIQLLEGDHKKMKTLMEELHKTTERAEKTRPKLFDEMRSQLHIHEEIEEQIFYPALREHKNAKDIVLEGYAEHHAVDLLMEKLESVEFDDENWGPQFHVIMEDIEHHVEEEEEKMFPTARKIFDKDELQQLGARMSEMKAEMESARY